MSVQGDGFTKPLMTFTDVLGRVQRDLVNLNSAVSQLSEVHKMELSYARAGLCMDPRPKAPPMLKIPKALEDRPDRCMQLSPETPRTSSSPGCMGKLQFKLPQKPRVNDLPHTSGLMEVAEEHARGVEDRSNLDSISCDLHTNGGDDQGEFGPSPRQLENDQNGKKVRLSGLSEASDGQDLKKVQALRSEVSVEIIEWDKQNSLQELDEMVPTITNATNATNASHTAATKSLPSIKRMTAHEDLFTLLPPVEPLKVWKGKTDMGMWTPNGMRASAQPLGQNLLAEMTEGNGKLSRKTSGNEENWGGAKSFQQGKERYNVNFSRVLVARPGSTRRLTWDVLGMLLIGYDLIILPFQVFEPDSNLFTDFMSWLTLAFWTLDIPSSFLVGFYAKGHVVMRASLIAYKYLRSWFFFDVSVVTADWIITILTIRTGTNKQTGVGQLKMGRALRFLRMMRLLRLLKVQGMLKDIVDRIRSEAFLILLGIVKLLLFITIVNHLIACGWFGVGQLSEMFYESERTWIFINKMNSRTIFYKYTTSLHWSWTQFTPASMEVVPVNSLERLYTVIILLFAMVTFSSFVSSITNAMTRLRNLDAERFKETAILRKYLQENHISMSLSSRIWGFLDSEGKKNQVKRTHEKDITLLLQLPWRLKDDLLEQVYCPVMTPHPFFLQFQMNFPAGLVRCFRETLEEVSMGIGHELFNYGGVADRMFFVIAGEMFYSLHNPAGVRLSHLCEKNDMGPLQSLQEDEAQQVVDQSSARGSDATECHKDIIAGAWFCEAPLWVPWKHRGQLTTVTYGELISIEGNAFQKLCMTELGLAAGPKYASLFAKFLTKQGNRITDVWDRDHLETLQEMAMAAFLPISGSTSSLLLGQEPNRKSVWRTVGSSGGGSHGLSPRNSSDAHGRLASRNTLEFATSFVQGLTRMGGQLSKSSSFQSARESSASVDSSGRTSYNKR